MFSEFEQKLVRSGLVDPGSAVMGFLDADLTWNRDDLVLPHLEGIVQKMSINSILFARPGEPYRTIIDHLAAGSLGSILPQDCETRTFLHDLPVARGLEADRIVSILKQRKGVIVPGMGVVSYGTVSLEQAYVTFSSICFACFVKFFADYLTHLRNRRADDRFQQAYGQAVRYLDPEPAAPGMLQKGLFDSVQQVTDAMCEAGRATVTNRLVDSYFGNLSCLWKDTLYISQTGSSLDSLEDCIDPVPLDGSSCTGITASSELAAHLEIIRKAGCNTILHGHPRFAVILSMDCDQTCCDLKGRCHIQCRKKRSVCGVPIVPGEVGTGSRGLCHTVPAAMPGQDGVIVYGHGLFTIGHTDFNRPFANLLSIENQCRQAYFQRVAALSD